MVKPSYNQNFYYDADFKETLEMCKKIFKKDSNIRKLVPENIKAIVEKNGNFSFGLRYLIMMYVEANKPGFLKSIEKQNEQPIT